MNYPQCSSRNFLLVENEKLDLDEILNFSVIQAEKGYRTLILTCNSILNLTNLNSYHLHDRKHLKKILIMYAENIGDMTTKLLNLHEWASTPNLIVLDIGSLFDLTRDKITSEAFKAPSTKQICFLISALFHYIQLMGKKNSFTAFSITVAEKKTLPKNLFHILVDLYFFNSNFSEFIALKNSVAIM